MFLFYYFKTCLLLYPFYDLMIFIYNPKELKLSQESSINKLRKLCRLLWNTNLVEIARAVISVSALVAILSSSISVSKDNTGTEECLCRDTLFFRAPEAVTTAK